MQSESLQNQGIRIKHDSAASAGVGSIYRIGSRSVRSWGSLQSKRSDRVTMREKESVS